MLNKVHAGRCKLRLSNHENTERKTDWKGISLLLLRLPSWSQKCLCGRACSPRNWSWMHWHSTAQPQKSPASQNSSQTWQKHRWLGYNVPQTCQKAEMVTKPGHKEKVWCRVQTWAVGQLHPSPAEYCSDWEYHWDCTAGEQREGKGKKRSEKMRVWLWKEKQRSRRALGWHLKERSWCRVNNKQWGQGAWQKLAPSSGKYSWYHVHSMICTALPFIWGGEEPWTPRELDLNSPPAQSCGYFSAWFITIQRPVRGGISHSPLSKGHKQIC